MKLLPEKWLLIIAVILTTAFFSGTGVQADVVNIYHLTDTVLLNDHPYSVFDVNENNSIIIEIPTGTTYYVKIMDNNPFLFDYLSDAVPIDSPSYSSVMEIMKNGVNMAARATLSSAKLSDDIEKALAARSAIIEMTLTDNGLIDARKIVNKWDIDKWMQYAVKETAKGAPDNPAAAAHQKKLLPNVTKLAEFKIKVLEVHSGLVIEKGINGRDTRKYIKQTITVKENSVFNDLLSNRVKEYRKKYYGTRTITYQPKSYVGFRGAIGPVYSFIEDPKYQAEKNSDGDRIITQTSNDYKGLGVAGMINVYPKPLLMTDFEPFLQLGAAWTGEDPAGMLGIGFSFFPHPVGDTIVSSLTLSGGIIGQEIDELPVGWQVGDNMTTRIVEGNKTITTYNTLETDKKWTTGFYLMLGAEF